MRIRSMWPVAGMIGVLACGTAPKPAPRPTPSASGLADRKDIRWFRSSAEYRGIALETYRAAGDHLLELTRGMAKGSWAVIMDADETILDNSLNERENVERHESYSETGWTRWVRRKAATAIPGAVEFTRTVHAMGGRIAVVTNRPDSLCDVSRENIRNVGVTADMVLCQQGKESDKNPRFDRVIKGTAMTGVPALKVVEWIGDNIQDFPNLTQAVRTTTSGYANFGIRYFLLPNPIYGSWEKNPEQ